MARCIDISLEFNWSEVTKMRTKKWGELVQHDCICVEMLESQVRQ